MNTTTEVKLSHNEIYDLCRLIERTRKHSPEVKQAYEKLLTGLGRVMAEMELNQ
jgi:hypothetical protein